jgi:hypothetical protein
MSTHYEGWGENHAYRCGKDDGFTDGHFAAVQACIAAVEGAVYVPLSKSGLFLISRNTKLWDQRETWTRHGWLKYRDSAIAALREVQP